MNTRAHLPTIGLEQTHFAPVRALTGLLRLCGLATMTVLAIVDAAWSRLVCEPSGHGLAHARAAWFSRWSRRARWFLGLGVRTRGYVPVSGVVVANHVSLLDAIVLASLRPCVFVAPVTLARRPILGLLARRAGTLFTDRQRPNEALRLNFMIQRALRRRLLVVIFPERKNSDGSILRAFGSTLFQPAVELGCSLTAAAIDYTAAQPEPRPLFARRLYFPAQLACLLTRSRPRAHVSFAPPARHAGGRKDLARQLRSEVLTLKGMSPELF